MKARALLTLIVITSPLAANEPTALERGNEAFKAGRFEEAAQAYESEESSRDLLTRRFNSGVSWAQAGSVDKSVERFQEVASKADGELRLSALYNAGHSAFTKAAAIAQEAEALEDPDERARKLAEAAESYQSAAQFFRSVDPPGAAVSRNLEITKTALRAVLDAIAKIEEEKRKRAEEEALKSPDRLVKALADKERLHRGMSRALAKESAQSVRLGSRRLRKSTAETRVLAEKLHHALIAPPPTPPAAQPGQPQPPATPEPNEEEKKRKERAAEAVTRAIEAMTDAEVSHSKLECEAAATAHSKAVVELRTASESFPFEIQEVIDEAIGRQESLNGAMDTLVRAETGGIAPEVKGEGFGKQIVDAIKDKVLLPLAKLVSPKSLEDAKLLTEDEDDVVWGAGILSKAEVPPTPAPPEKAPGHPPVPPEGPQLSAEEAKKLTEDLQTAGKEALEASTRAREELAQGLPIPALPHGKKTLEVLQRAAELLPKPPKPPEERLKELIDRQKAASNATQEVATLAEDSKAPARKSLEQGQRTDGKEAGGIASELEKTVKGAAAAGGAQPPAQVSEAVKKIHEGEEKVFGSAELLSQAKDADAKTAIDSDIKLFEEALALLQGKKDKKDEEKKKDPQQDQQKKQDSKQKKQADKDKQEQKPYALSPRDARFRQQDMDRKRREEEKKLFSAPSTLSVERDW